MTKRQRTEKSKYKHTTTGDHCTCAAYIAELMCLRSAAFQGISGLPHKFWNTSKWSWTFKRQMMLANSIIKKYGEVCLVKTVHLDSLKTVFSLNHPAVEKALIETCNKLEKEKQEPQEIKPIEEVKTIRKQTFGKKSMLNKMRELDGKSKKE